MDKNQILNRFKNQLKNNKHLIGVAAGSGLSAKYAVKGGADFILALNSGKYRQSGLGALGGYLPYENCNKSVMDFASKEILTRIPNTPIFFGLCATDPTIRISNYLDKIKKLGFAGINNYPTVGIIDGNFRNALEEEGLGYDLEVEAIKIANEKDLLTIAFVFTKEEAIKMANVGADIICSHLGLTQGGILGAKKVISLKRSVEKTEAIFEEINKINSNIIKMIYGGPITSTIDLKYMYDNTSTDGYIGGSTFERIPSEEAITETTLEFKTAGSDISDELYENMLSGILGHYDYVSFIKKYISEQYMNDLSLSNLAEAAHISRSHLSTLFNEEVGCSFSEYLANYRINKSKDIFEKTNLTWTQISYLVGYKSYSYFSRSFKKIEGITPKQYKKINKP